MNNKYYIEEVLKILYNSILETGSPLTKNQVYNYLTRFGVDDQLFGSCIKETRENVSFYVDERISTLINSDDGLSPVKRYRAENQGQEPIYFTHMNVSFDDKREAPVRDVIKMYIPLGINCLEYNLKMIYNFLIENKINFQSKISNFVRCDTFVVRVDSKEDAEKIIAFCNNTPTITGNIGYSNPFIPTKDGIGIAHDTYGISYNGFVSDAIAEYLKESYQSGLQKCDFDLFAKFVSDKRETCDKDKKNRGSNRHFLYDELSNNLNTISKQGNPLDSISNTYGINYNHELYMKYKRYMDKDGHYQYKELRTGKFIEFQSAEWIELQAMNFLSKATELNGGERPNKSFIINDELVSYCLTNYDKIKDGNLTPVPSTYQNAAVDSLYPYFYSYLALSQRNASLENALEMAHKIKSSMVETNENQEKQFKNISFVTSIPMINLEDISVGIELIDNINPDVKGLCNISVIKGGKITKYNNVFVELDYELLYPSKDNHKYASIYRASVGRLLSDLERNRRMMETRDGHFGVLKFDEQKGVKKFYNPEYISKMSKYKLEGFVPEKYQEEGVMSL